MTPKEKAKELVRQYWDLGGIDILKAKQCALIAVDGILENNKILFEDVLNDQYLKEVKTEINLL